MGRGRTRRLKGVVDTLKEALTDSVPPEFLPFKEDVIRFLKRSGEEFKPSEAWLKRLCERPQAGNATGKQPVVSATDGDTGGSQKSSASERSRVPSQEGVSPQSDSSQSSVTQHSVSCTSVNTTGSTPSNNSSGSLPQQVSACSSGQVSTNSLDMVPESLNNPGGIPTTASAEGGVGSVGIPVEHNSSIAQSADGAYQAMSANDESDDCDMAGGKDLKKHANSRVAQRRQNERKLVWPLNCWICREPMDRMEPYIMCSSVCGRAYHVSCENMMALKLGHTMKPIDGNVTHTLKNANKNLRINRLPKVGHNENGASIGAEKNVTNASIGIEGNEHSASIIAGVIVNGCDMDHSLLGPNVTNTQSVSDVNMLDNTAVDRLQSDNRGVMDITPLMSTTPTVPTADTMSTQVNPDTVHEWRKLVPSSTGWVRVTPNCVARECSFCMNGRNGCSGCNNFVPIGKLARCTIQGCKTAYCYPDCLKGVRTVVPDIRSLELHKMVYGDVKRLLDDKNRPVFICHSHTCWSCYDCDRYSYLWETLWRLEAGRSSSDYMNKSWQDLRKTCRGKVETSHFAKGKRIPRPATYPELHGFKSYMQSRRFGLHGVINATTLTTLYPPSDDEERDSFHKVVTPVLLKCVRCERTWCTHCLHPDAQMLPQSAKQMICQDCIHLEKVRSCENAIQIKQHLPQNDSINPKVIVTNRHPRDIYKKVMCHLNEQEIYRSKVACKPCFLDPVSIYRDIDISKPAVRNSRKYSRVSSKGHLDDLDDHDMDSDNTYNKPANVTKRSNSRPRAIKTELANIAINSEAPDVNANIKVENGVELDSNRTCNSTVAKNQDDFVDSMEYDDMLEDDISIMDQQNELAHGMTDMNQDGTSTDSDSSFSGDERKKHRSASRKPRVSKTKKINDLGTAPVKQELLVQTDVQNVTTINGNLADQKMDHSNLKQDTCHMHNGIHVDQTAVNERPPRRTYNRKQKKPKQQDSDEDSIQDGKTTSRQNDITPRTSIKAQLRACLNRVRSKQFNTVVNDCDPTTILRICTEFRYMTANVITDDSLRTLASDAPYGRCNCKISCRNGCTNATNFVECTNNNCGLGDDNCGNRRFKNMGIPKLRLRCVPGKGLGAFASEDIAQNELVCEYVGKVITQNEFQRCVSSWSFAELDNANNSHWYIMKIHKDVYIDSTNMGNVARFINHSCEPNCVSVPYNVSGTFRMGVFAQRRIAKGEEVTYNYGFSSRGVGGGFKCLCGAANCRGMVGVQPDTTSETIEDIEKTKIQGVEAESLSQLMFDLGTLYGSNKDTNSIKQRPSPVDVLNGIWTPGDLHRYERSQTKLRLGAECKKDNAVLPPSPIAPIVADNVQMNSAQLNYAKLLVLGGNTLKQWDLANTKEIAAGIPWAVVALENNNVSLLRALESGCFFPDFYPRAKHFIQRVAMIHSRHCAGNQGCENVQRLLDLTWGSTEPCYVCSGYGDCKNCDHCGDVLHDDNNCGDFYIDQSGMNLCNVCQNSSHRLEWLLASDISRERLAMDLWRLKMELGYIQSREVFQQVLKDPSCGEVDMQLRPENLFCTQREFERLSKSPSSFLETHMKYHNMCQNALKQYECFF
ncbi:histone lysine methyltransferase SET2 [Babesia ovis]|uniref:Histone lysine methyltransferase SET2 n=1 Tax=Babesia ovis TaxID=5869 RepID=A0A9W5T927_BABOV|nr:histone lysine methyltransferase SET2 [Babesia ovis]